MLVLFGTTLAVLIVAALALGVGLAWARPLLGGGCRTGLVAGGLLPGCEACPALAAGPDGEAPPIRGADGPDMRDAPDLTQTADAAADARGGSGDAVRT